MLELLFSFNAKENLEFLISSFLINYFYQKFYKYIIKNYLNII